MANAGVEYMASQVRILSRPNTDVGERPLADLVAIDLRGECRKDYISNEPKWRLIAPAVATPCSKVFPFLSPHLRACQYRFAVASGQTLQIKV
jgi:hypothetical protein